VKLTGKEKEIKEYRKQGMGKSGLGRMFGVNRMTVDRFMKDNGIE
jgi:DNA-binding CsgD family transcriptional regulator